MTDQQITVTQKVDRVISGGIERCVVAVAAPARVIHHDAPVPVIRHATDRTINVGRQGPPGQNGYGHQEIFHDATMPTVSAPSLWLTQITAPSGKKYLAAFSNYQLT